jgi:hypothetical protein
VPWVFQRHNRYSISPLFRGSLENLTMQISSIPLSVADILFRYVSRHAPPEPRTDLADVILSSSSGISTPLVRSLRRNAVRLCANPPRSTPLASTDRAVSIDAVSLLHQHPNSWAGARSTPRSRRSRSDRHSGWSSRTRRADHPCRSGEIRRSAIVSAASCVTEDTAASYDEAPEQLKG